MASPFLINPQSSTLRVSDLISGAAALVLSGFSLRNKSVWPQWTLAGVGVWLLSAPLIFWAPRAMTYINDSIAGLCLITFAVILPYSTPTGGPETPEDWSYNPSAWKQRVPIVAIGFIAYLAATWLAFFQLGYIDTLWDPFFGEGTKRVLRSDVSRAFPVSDAGLGALAYILECISGLIGDIRRWRTLPWMTLLFWVLVVPAGVVSIVLVMLQPMAVGAWCTLCLTTATLTLITIPPAMDEMILSTQFLLKARRQGKNVWRLFWSGEVQPGPPPKTAGVEEESDFSLPSWNLCISAVLGLWLMAAPAVLGIEGRLANSHFMTGALVITFAVIAMAEVGRPLRFVKIPLGLWALLAPWLFSEGPSVVRWVDGLAGILIIGFSRPLGPLKDRHGAWDRYVRWGVRV